MRFSTKECITGWIPLQVGIAMGCAISPPLFVLAMQIVLNAVGDGIHEARMGRVVHMPFLKSVHGRHHNRLKQEADRSKSLDKLNDLLH